MTMFPTTKGFNIYEVVVELLDDEPQIYVVLATHPDNAAGIVCAIIGEKEDLAGRSVTVFLAEAVGLRFYGCAVASVDHAGSTLFVNTPVLLRGNDASVSRWKEWLADTIKNETIRDGTLRNSRYGS